MIITGLLLSRDTRPIPLHYIFPIATRIPRAIKSVTEQAHFRLKTIIAKNLTILIRRYRIISSCVVVIRACSAATPLGCPRAGCVSVDGVERNRARKRNGRRAMLSSPISVLVQSCACATARANRCVAMVVVHGEWRGRRPVSYTHLTLPTKRIV